MRQKVSKKWIILISLFYWGIGMYGIYEYTKNGTKFNIVIAFIMIMVGIIITYTETKNEKS